jgi:predicted flap endonuclease-1-like 5' DNA nuclease
MNSPLTISIDPIIYFFTHSLLIIAVSAVMFMGMGVWIGHLTWARFKRRARAFQEECDLLRHEIAALKRRIGEEQAGPAPLVLINEDAPVPAMADQGPELPGFTLSAAAKPAVVSAPAPAKTGEETLHESLAAVVIGPAGAPHHTLEPVAPPDAITELGLAPPSTKPEEKQAGAPRPSSPDGPQSAATNGTVPPGATKETAPPKPVSAQKAFAAELADGSAVEDPALGILLRFQPERWDDLTLLRGVGEVLQQRLHDHGVHTFKQIAYWTDANVQAFSAKIDARDRIQREHWVNQARDMHFLKYGEELG